MELWKKNSAHKVWVPPEKISGDKAHIMNNQKPKCDGKNKNHSLRRYAGRSVRGWGNLGNVLRTVQRCLWSDKGLHTTERSDNCISEQSGRPSSFDPKTTGLGFSDKVAIVGVIMTLMMLCLLVVPRSFEPGSMAFGTCYFAIEMASMATLCLSISLLFFTRVSGVAFSVLRFTSFFCFIWFSWGAYDKFNQLLTGWYRVTDFYNTDLVSKIEIGFTGAFVFAIIFELWKTRLQASRTE